MNVPKVDIKQLLEAGVHLGHKTLRWNPKMKKYIFGEKNSIHIIDLTQTLEFIKTALIQVHKTIASGGKLLVVSTKKQASEQVSDLAKETGQFFVNFRWLGGMLTNWKTIKVPINKLLEYQENKASGELQSMIKKEAVMLEKEMKKLSLVFDGVKDMKGLPDALFVIDVENEKIAVQEALKMGIPVYGLVDTNSNPSNLTNFVPINDDSSKTIKFVLDLLSEAVLEGQDSARKQGLVQKLDGDKGPKVFSMNTATKVISVKAEEKSEAAIEAKAEEKIEAQKDEKTTTKKPAAKKATAAKKPAAKKADK